MFRRVFFSVAVASLAIGTLTACDPPMPPEVLAALAEQTFICEPGQVAVSYPNSMTDEASMNGDAILGNCSDMIATVAAAPAGADIQITQGPKPSSECQPFATVPYAIDAAVVITNMPNFGSLNLTPKLASDIFSGKITSWNDAAFAKVNPGYVPEDTAITVIKQTQKNALDSFGAWMKSIDGKTFSSSLLTPQAELDPLAFTDLPYGSIALVPNSLNLIYALNATDTPIVASIMVDKNPDNAVFADTTTSIPSAATQFRVTKTENVVKLKHDSGIKPLPPIGSDVAPGPYEAVYAVSLSLCAADTKVKRAVARYLLRQDSQGMFVNVVALPENIRGESLALVSQGLPQPTAAPEN